MKPSLNKKNNLEAKIEVRELLHRNDVLNPYLTKEKRSTTKSSTVDNLKFLADFLLFAFYGSVS